MEFLLYKTNLIKKVTIIIAIIIKSDKKQVNAIVCLR
jgi:hypothetical protein